MGRAEALAGIARRDFTRDWEAELAFEDAIDRNDRILRLAEHNGYPIELAPFHDGKRLFYVPIQLGVIAGAHALVVR